MKRRRGEEEGEDEERGGGKWKVKMRGRRVHHRTRTYLLNMVP